MTYLTNALRKNPELAIFLTLAVGFVIGRLRIGTFSLGNVVGTLLAGVLIGQLDIEVDPARQARLLRPLPLRDRLQGRARSSSGGSEKNALPQVALTVVLCVTSLAVDGRGREDLRVRLRDGGGTDGRRLHGVDGHRHGGRHDQPARPAGGGEDRGC